MNHRKMSNSRLSDKITALSKLAVWLASRGYYNYNAEGGERIGLRLVLILGMDIGQIGKKLEHSGKVSL